MIYGLQDHDRYVYHYTNAEVARDHILGTQTLRLGELVETNDPRESAAWEFSLWTDGTHDLGRYDLQELSEWLSTELKAKTKICCLSADRNPLTGNEIRDILQRGFARARMWAQYASRHSGVCLVFDRAALVSAFDAGFAGCPRFRGRVSYRDHLIVRQLGLHEFAINIDMLESLGREGYVQWHVAKHYDRLYFEKLLDWRDESEWRLALLSTFAGPAYLPINKALVGVVHGTLIDPRISSDLVTMTRGMSVAHMGLLWKNSNPWYDLTGSRWSSYKLLMSR